MESITQAVEREMNRAYEESGIAGFQHLIKSQLEEWQGMPMNVAVIGQSGVGKSSLINAFRLLNADDDGAAAVGCTETTEIIEQYVHPDNKQLVFTDLPGAGTPKFPKKSYMEIIGVDKYDFFLLVTKARFYENDAWLATELANRKKGCFFIRTHMDNEVDNDRKAHRRSQRTEEKVVAEIREKTENELTKLTSTNIICFLIDSYEPQKYDFSDLEQQLIANFPELKKEALMLTLRTRNAAMIKQKKECLKSRIWKAATASAGIAVIPIPGVSFAADVTILVFQTKFYFEQFGLDSASLERLAQTTNKDFSQLNAEVRNAFGGFDVLALTPANFGKFTCALGVSLTLFSAESVAEATVSVIPVVGTALASSMSFLTTRWLLGQVLERMYNIAVEVYDSATVQLCTA